MKTAVAFLELEITGRCGLRCAHCYAESGPRAGHSPLTADQWEQVITDAAGAGVKTVQFIGGEPTLHPFLPRLARHALGVGLGVQVYTNLVHVTDDLWDLFQQPGVRLGVSWYSAHPDEHARITGSTASYHRTLSNLAQAVARGIPVKVGIVQVFTAQDVDGAAAQLRDLGVTDITIDRARPVGRAAVGRTPSPEDLCGRCGDGRAAIGADGTVFPCVLGRFLPTGNIVEQPLAEILAGPRWREVVAAVPHRGGPGCAPADSNDCNPAI